MDPADKPAGFPARLLEIDIPASERAAYQAALRSGNVAALKAILLRSCRSEDRSLVDSFLPAGLLLEDQS